MSPDNGTTEDTQTEQEKANDMAIMHMRMAIRQLQSGDWKVTSAVYSTTPVAVGTNKAGLTKYQSRVANLGLGLDIDKELDDEPIAAPPVLPVPADRAEARA